MRNIGLQLLETYRRPIGDLSETDMPDRRPIGDRHAWPENNRRPTCLIGDLSKTEMPHRRPIRDRHASLETNMSHRRPTCLIGAQHVSSGTIRTCLVYNGSLMRHVGLWWVSDEACWSPIRHCGLQSDILQWVSYQTCRSPMRLR